MKGNEQQLVEFLENNKRFCIPLYQRNYDWKEGNCRQLFSDLLRIHEDGSKSHFFGSIVYSQSEANGDERLIIDGQQRITTVSLILIAMINAAKSDELPSEDKDYYIQNVSERFLIDKWRKTERKVKLKPIKKDMEAFDALLFKSPEEFIMDSVVTRNYLFFYDEVKKCGLKLEEILEAINKLEIISIWLGKDDDPQLIFESLNSTGLDLSESDKIRNNLLMSLNSKEQEEAYDKYWNKIEIATAYQPTMFIRDYLTIKSKANKVAKIENLYFEFKTYSSESGLSKMEQMADMLKYAIQYDKIQKADLGDSVINKLLRQLSYIDTQQYMPFLVQFFIYAEESGMPLADRQTVVQTIECYMARRIICGLPANALNKVFASLHSDIMKHIKEFEKHDEPFVSSYPEVLKYVLIRKQGNSELPSDNKVAEEMRVRNVYKMPLAYRYFMFERMNNGLSKEFVDIVGNMKNGTIFIEHIMPQTLSPRWKNDLGPNFQEIHDKYLHTFANLTLSAYNQSYSNSSFDEKRNGTTDRNGKQIVGYKDSIYSIGADLKGYSQWTETEILDRQHKLIEKFKTIWPMPTSTFKPIERPVDNVMFSDEDTELTGRTISAFTYKGTRQEVDSWKSMLAGLCAMVYREHKSSIDFLCSQKGHFHTEPHDGCSQISLTCYVDTANSTKDKISIIKKMFSECSLSEDDLSFDLVPIAQEA